jgi:hypothetical protein
MVLVVLLPASLFGQTCSDPIIDMKALVIASDINDSSLRPVTQTLDYIGVPYTVQVGAPHFALADGCHGFYQAIFMVGFVWSSDPLYDPGFTDLWDYVVRFGIRTVNIYSWPYPDYGFANQPPWPIGSGDVPANLTSAGQAVFTYLNPSVVLNPMEWTILEPAGNGGVALLVDQAGNALATTNTLWDGREFLTLTFPMPEWRLISWAVSYGLVNWATKGLFLGERHIYLSPQVDDFFLADDIWVPGTTCGTPTDQTGATYRMTGNDLQVVLNWQNNKRSDPLTKNFRLSFAFNGEGTIGYSPDTLTPKAKKVEKNFYWINHSYDHENLDNASFQLSKREIMQNYRVATRLELTNFEPLNMVTPDVSGLTNPNFLKAAYNSDIRYLVTNASIPEWNNPSPNAGFYSAYQPSILLIPRHANDLFYNVSQPAEWEAEYHCIYAGQSPYDTYTVDQIIAFQRDTFLLPWMLKGDMDPLMFHQPNLRAYDGTHFLLGDLLDSTLTEYKKIFNLPVLSPSMDKLGQRMANRMAYNAAGVTASLVPGKSITIKALRPAVVPVTGLKTSGAEMYGGQWISHIKLKAGRTITLPLQ